MSGWRRGGNFPGVREPEVKRMSVLAFHAGRDCSWRIASMDHERRRKEGEEAKGKRRPADIQTRRVGKAGALCERVRACIALRLCRLLSNSIPTFPFLFTDV